MASRNRFCRQYLQKVNAKCPQFFDEKKSFVSLRNNFWSFKKREKRIFINGKKPCLFHQKSEGILHLLFAGIACKIYFLMPSNFDEKMPLDYDKFCPLKMMAFMIIKSNIICWHFLKALPSADNFHCILRVMTVYFWDEVFSLGMPSVCPHLTTVCLNKRGRLKQGLWSKSIVYIFCRNQY